MSWGNAACVGHIARDKPEVQLKREATPWLAYEGKWGSTVEAPALQEWFARAENPVSRAWLAQVSSLSHIMSPISTYFCYLFPPPVTACSSKQGLLKQVIFLASCVIWSYPMSPPAISLFLMLLLCEQSHMLCIAAIWVCQLKLVA